MFLTNLGAIIAVSGSLLVLGGVGMATLIRALSRKPHPPEGAILRLESFRVRSAERERQPAA